MLTDGSEATDYLVQLYKSTSGDPAAQVSMYDVGAAVGMDKTEAGKAAEALIGNGLAEVKTLSGGIAITPEGLQAAQVADGGLGNASDLDLGSNPVLDDRGRQSMETLMSEVKQEIAGLSPTYPSLEEIVIDVKTAEVQLLSPSPKTSIVREVLRSLQKVLAAGGSTQLSARLKRITEK